MEEEIILTPTAIELMNDKNFWKKRMYEQADWLQAYAQVEHNRPDHMEVAESIVVIGERCIREYQRCCANESTKA